MCAIFINMTTEIWRDIKWWEWLYRVSNKWRIISLNYRRTWKPSILKPFSFLWYHRINLKHWNIIKNVFIHRIVAINFIPNPEDKRTVNHKNWIKDDNRVENLEWATDLENIRHAISNSLWDYKKWWILNKVNLQKWVIQFDKNLNFIKKYESMTIAYYSTWISISSISQCASWKMKSAWWFIWKKF